jgi:PHS family inorganic phosphate transporter-like MFS transporter
MAKIEAARLSDALNDAPLDLFHLRAMITAGMGFFTDAYDLFIIGVAVVLIKQEFHPTTLELSAISAGALLSAFIGATIFGWVSDRFGRKSIYGLEATIMAIAALATAFSPNIIWLIVWRFILGMAIGGDYPVSAVLMSEYANTKDRGKLVGLVFSMQAVGLVAGPVVALALLGAGVPHDIAWRLMLGLGALPAMAVIYLRRTMPESPRYLSRVKGQTEMASRQMQQYTQGRIQATGSSEGRVRGVHMGRFLLTLLGTAGTWFVFDYAYYGNSISTPLILKEVAPGASIITSTAWTLLIFAVAAVPGYILAFNTMDRIGHKRLQLIGFICMGLAFLAIGIVPGLTKVVIPFLIVYGISYFFAEFGPNTTTFVLSAELFPVNVRTTGHGISAGVAKIGAFIGVFLFPIIEAALGLNGTLTITFVFAVVGALLTLILPEPARKSLEAVSEEDRYLRPDPQVLQPVAN